MKIFVHLTALGVMALPIEPAFAQQPASGTKDAQTTQTTPSPAEFDKQYAKMQEQMAKMQEEMERIRQTKDPKEREQLLKDHWTSMQNAMTTMHGMMGSMGCCGAGGRMGQHMMGGPMMGGHMIMWSDYSKLTPEQLKQRQYMTDRWMPMQQMMMDHMMQHQNWMMMQPQQSTAPNR
jgi:hypothetical protein